MGKHIAAQIHVPDSNFPAFVLSVGKQGDSNIYLGYPNTGFAIDKNDPVKVQLFEYEIESNIDLSTGPAIQKVITEGDYYHFWMQTAEHFVKEVKLADSIGCDFCDSRIENQLPGCALLGSKAICINCYNRGNPEYHHEYNDVKMDQYSFEAHVFLIRLKQQGHPYAFTQMTTFDSTDDFIKSLKK